MRRRVVFTAIGLLCGIAFAVAPPADARLAWYGFSQLCFEGEWKGGPVTDGDLTITLIDFTVQTRCDNLQNSQESCQSGVGNAGDFKIEVPAQSTDPTKTTGIITAKGCLDLGIFDDHYETEIPLGTHQHTCNPLTNVNKVERKGSAHVTQINTEWVLTNTNAAGVTKVIRRGKQTCQWPGTFNDDPTVCAPQDQPSGDPIQFECPIDLEFKK